MADTSVANQEKTRKDPKSKPRQKPDQLPPYHVILLDDNQHSFEYVIEMLQSLFGHNEQFATRLAHQVDRTGRAIVCTTHKERAELKRDQISGYGSDFRIASCKGSMTAVIQAAES